MLSDEEKRELKELINLMYNNHISQYGKRKLEAYIKKQSKEIEELKEERLTLFDTTVKNSIKINDKKWEDKIKAKIEEYKKQQKEEPDAYLCIKVLQSLLGKE